MDETRVILIQIGFINPNSNVWTSEWFGVFILAKTATPMELAQFIFNRGFNKGYEEANKAHNLAISFPTEVYVADPNQRPIHAGTGMPVVIEVPTTSINSITLCKRIGCNEPMYEWGLCFKHHCEVDHQ